MYDFYDQGIEMQNSAIKSHKKWFDELMTWLQLLPTEVCISVLLYRAIQTVQGQVTDLHPHAMLKYSVILRAMANGILILVHLWPFSFPRGSHLSDAWWCGMPHYQHTLTRNGRRSLGAIFWCAAFVANVVMSGLWIQNCFYSKYLVQDMIAGTWYWEWLLLLLRDVAC